MGWRASAALFLLLLFTGARQDAAAHAYLERSEPAGNAVLAAAPEAIRIWFTEPLETAYIGMELFDARGRQLSTPAPSVDADDRRLLVLMLPAALDTGTYTVAWRNISAVDGHPTEGFFAFTVGTQTDVEVPTAPDATQFDGPPTAVQAVGRWLVLLGLMGIFGMLVTAFLVLPPGLAHLAPSVQAQFQRRLRWLMLGGLGAACAGSFVLLAAQAATVAAGSFLSATADLLADSNFGRYWLIRECALLVLAVLLFLTPRLESLGRERKWLLAVLALLTLIPIALTSHAAAIGTGARAATVADGLHLAAGSVWVGGLLAMATLLVSLRGQPGAQRRAVLGDVIPRFSTLAIASVLLLVASGFYATWLQVGNLTALVETDHGVTLLLKLILVLVMLGLGALNLLILTPRLASAAASGYEFGRTVLSEALLGVVVLLLVGILTSLPTARGEIEASSGRLTRQLSDSGTTAQLIISPGAVGANRYTVDVEPGVELPPSSALFLRLRSSGGELTGLSEIELQRTGAQRFEASGSELSVVGSWEIEAILRRPDRPDWRSTSAAEIGVETPHAARPGDAVRFAGSAGGVSMLAALLGVPALAAGLRMPRRRALLIAGGCLLLAGCAGLALTAGYG